jgi:hypothetical protein
VKNLLPSSTKNQPPCGLAVVLGTILGGDIFREANAMNVLVLIEPIEAGCFRARAGDPFGLSAEGKTEEEAVQRLKTILCDRLQSGSRLALLDLENGASPRQAALQLEPLPDDDWFFQTMREVIAENRQREDEANG